jgi:hypothetical protein
MYTLHQLCTHTSFSIYFLVINNPDPFYVISMTISGTTVGGEGTT